MPSFLRELRRRHVLKVGGVYVVAAIATVEAADVLFPRLDLPDWTVSLAVALAVIGLPIALVLAWAYQLTPEGIERDRAGTSGAGSAAPVDEGPPRPPVRAGSGARPAPATIAVLPFIDMSVATDQEYLADGLAEEILNGLTRLRNLKVAARTSSFAFKGRNEDVREVGRALDVAHLLEGSVRKWGDRIRVTAQLIDARDGYHLWSEVYDRQLDDIFRIQDDIARTIVERLEVELIEEERGGPLVVEHTQDPEAFDLYLKGRHAWYNRYRVGLQTALTYFERARERDPDFPLAHCGVADTYAVLGLYGLLEPQEAKRRICEAADRAMDLAPDLPEAFFSRGMCAAVFPRVGPDGPVWDFSAFRQALERRPDYGEAAGWHGLATAGKGEATAEETRAMAARIRSVDPDSAYVADIAGLILSWAGLPGEALLHLREGLAHNPEDVVALFGTGNALLDLGRAEEALPHFRKVAELTNRASAFLGMLGYGLARAGRRDEAGAILRELLQRNEEGYVLPVVIAAVAANVGKGDTALDFLEEASDWSRHPACAWWLRFPVWDSLLGEPRFRAVYDRLGMVLA